MQNPAAWFVGAGIGGCSCTTVGLAAAPVAWFVGAGMGAAVVGDPNDAVTAVVGDPTDAVLGTGSGLILNTQ